MVKKRLIFILCLIGVFQLQAQIDTYALTYQARLQLANERFFDVIKTTTRIIAYRPNAQEAYFFRGIAKYNLNDFQGAKRDFEHTIALNPFYSDAYQFLGNTEEVTGNFALAIQLYDKTISLSPYKSQAYLSRGIAHYRIKKYQQAKHDLDSAIILNPDLPRAYFVKAFIEEEEGDNLSALVNINKAIQLNPFMKEAILKRANLKFERENYEGALIDIEQCLKLDKNNPLAYFHRANILSKQKKYDEALVDFNKVLDLDHANALALYNRAILFYETKEIDKAIDDFTRAAQINPNNILIYYARALAYFDSKKYHQAIEDLKKTIDIYPLYAKAYLLRAMIYQKRGQAKAANTDRLVYQELSGMMNEDMDWANDSVYLKEIVNFDAEFVAVDQVKKRQIQYQDADLHLKPDVFFMVRQADYNLNIYDKIQEVNYRGEAEQIVYYLSLSNLQIEKLKQIYEKKEKDYLVNFVLGTCYGLQNDYNKAHQALSESIKQNPSFAYSYANRAYFSAKLNEFADQIENEKQSLMTIGGAYSSKDVASNSQFVDDELIIKDYKKAASLRQDLMIQYNLANALAINQEFIEAITYYQKALEKSEVFALASFNKALIEFKIRDYSSACKSMSRAGELGEKDAYALIKKFCK